MTLTRLLTVLLFGSSLMLPAVAEAATPLKIYSAKPQITAAAGSTVQVPVRIDSAATAIDTTDIMVSFPAGSLQFEGLDQAGSSFNTVVPSSPVATDGHLEFSAASLRPATISGDALVSTLLFKALGTSGTAQVSLQGSAAARNGQNYSAATTPATVSFQAPAGGSTAFNLSDFKAVQISQHSATVTWLTSSPADSSVEYGSTGNYGQTANAAALTTVHSVQLADNFPPATTVHWRAISVSSGGQQLSSDQTFTTTGYKVQIQVQSHGRAVVGAHVTLDGQTRTTAVPNGQVTFQSVAPGDQKVRINQGKSQLIAVKAVSGSSASAVQTFRLASGGSWASWWYALDGLVLLVIIAATLRSYRRRRQVA